MATTILLIVIAAWILGQTVRGGLVNRIFGNAS